MKILMMLVVVIGVLALLGTVLLGGKGDNNYDEKTKGNISRLSLIYIILAISIIIAFAIYLF
ncbi:heme/copper-type cytochrome/quinol oxidase subunit 2 [Metabacillus crassostreae]|uniref:hypothetical protein n=1 Tax=Metabacillus crassostreae TaxID=929098 RepID=UPI00195F15EF|nr:hypothetical protein [Metabacillus crassostreae]MBM7603786.1 heme/copper-type cytochrome/quinol oxidase subunit 2 [Metabacillus crassostreae]